MPFISIVYLFLFFVLVKNNLIEGWCTGDNACDGKTSDYKDFTECRYNKIFCTFTEDIMLRDGSVGKKIHHRRCTGYHECGKEKKPSEKCDNTSTRCYYSKKASERKVRD